jgi:hypothetical protein
MSRASWYRHGKPAEKPGAVGGWFRREELKHWRSKRTVERVNRIMRLVRGREKEICLAAAFCFVARCYLRPHQTGDGGEGSS